MRKRFNDEILPTLEGRQRLLMEKLFNFFCSKNGGTYKGEQHGVWNTQQHLGELIGCKPRQIRNLLNDLRDAGWIQWESIGLKLARKLAPLDRSQARTSFFTPGLKLLEALGRKAEPGEETKAKLPDGSGRNDLTQPAIVAASSFTGSEPVSDSLVQPQAKTNAAEVTSGRPKRRGFAPKTAGTEERNQDKQRRESAFQQALQRVRTATYGPWEGLMDAVSAISPAQRLRVIATLNANSDLTSTQAMQLEARFC